MKKVWSRYPRESYIVDGEGVGALPVFDAVPGAWNLLALGCSTLDQLEVYNPDTEITQIPTQAIALSVFLALQWDPMRNQYVGEVAETLRPAQFLEYFRNSGLMPTPEALLTSAWWTFMEDRAAAWEPPAPNVVKVQFGRKKI